MWKKSSFLYYSFQEVILTPLRIDINKLTKHLNFILRKQNTRRHLVWSTKSDYTEFNYEIFEIFWNVLDWNKIQDGCLSCPTRLCICRLCALKSYGIGATFKGDYSVAKLWKYFDFFLFHFNYNGTRSYSWSFWKQNQSEHMPVYEGRGITLFISGSYFWTSCMSRDLQGILVMAYALIKMYLGVMLIIGFSICKLKGTVQSLNRDIYHGYN